jgi:hypothetical protein
MRVSLAAVTAFIIGLFCICIFWIGHAHAQSTITIGETNVLSTGDGGNGNLLCSQNTTLSQTATIDSLSFYVTTAAGNLRLGIYDATGPNGGPGALKAQTSSFKAVKGWNTANVVTPVTLQPGTYWLAYLAQTHGRSIFGQNFERSMNDRCD